ncbi:MAG: DUF2236 domain-containing protein [Acidimicrobiales bacterium]|nr:DUF2236 domain-containing protein [Acidimicrobiales bacterium]
MTATITPATRSATASSNGTKSAGKKSIGKKPTAGTARTRRSIRPAAQALLDPYPLWVPETPTLLELAVGVTSATAAALASPLLVGPLTKALSPLGVDPAKLEPTPEEMGDPGWFGPDSVAWRVHTEPAMLIAGIAAFTLQSLHPLAMAGVAEHSAFSEDFLGRTQRTADFVQCVVYGSSIEAAAICRTVRKVHDHVVGVAPDGRPYSANDPELLHWVHVAQYATIGAANRRFGVHPMSRSELDTYIGEVARVGTEIGVLDPPTDWKGLMEGIERHRPNLAIAQYASAGLAFLVRPPFLPDLAQPVWRALWHGAIACLPPSARDLLCLPTPTPQQLAATRVLLRILQAPGGTPPRLLAARKRLGISA